MNIIYDKSDLRQFGFHYNYVVLTHYILITFNSMIFK